MAVRKQRSKQFVSNKYAAFNMLFTLAFHYLLTRVAATAFALMNADRDDIANKKPTQREEGRLRKRLRFKGAQAFLEAEQQQKNPGSTMTEVFANTAEVIDLLWQILTSPSALNDTIFAVVVSFWPQGASRQDMLDRITVDILKTLCGLKWRILYQSHMPPYKYIYLHTANSDDDNANAAASEATAELLGFASCCLDPFWARPVQSELKQIADPSEQASRLQYHINNFASNCRGVSSREENMHAQQRVSAGGFKSKAALFPRQAAECVLRNSLDNFTSRTGIVGNTAPPEVKAASRVARTRKVCHKRPRQFGSTMIFYMSARKREGANLSNKELRDEWANLPQPAKARWKAQHVAKVASQRLAKRMVQQSSAANDSGASRSPWGIGDNRHPLKEEHLKRFLQPFQKRATGIDALAQCTSPEAVQLHTACVNRETKYHSSDCGTVAARELLGKVIDDHNSTEKTWGEVTECTRQKHGCFEKHPGICATVDEKKLSQIEALSRVLPQGSNILMFELGSRPARDRLAIYVRVITGHSFFRRVSC